MEGVSHLTSFSSLVRKWMAGKDIYEVKRESTFHLYWKQEFNWVALEDVGQINFNLWSYLITTDK